MEQKTEDLPHDMQGKMQERGTQTTEDKLGVYCSKNNRQLLMKQISGIKGI